jgi:hypothetical protein
MSYLKMMFVWGLLVCQALFPNEEKNRKPLFDYKSCSEILKKVGVKEVVAGVIGAGVLWAWSRQGASDNRKTVSAKLPPKMPVVADIKIADLQGDQDLYRRASDLADYLLQKYQEDKHLVWSLERFTQTYPEEAAAALNARFPKEFQESRNPNRVLSQLGKPTYYALIFAWILREVYNEDLDKSHRTLRSVIEEIEKKIGQVGSRGR